MAREKPAAGDRARAPAKPRPEPTPGPSKKMGSLSSFQPMLSFAPSAWSSKPSASTSSSSLEDRKRMPPPAAAVLPKIPIIPKPTNGRSHTTSGKGKGKADDPLEIDSDGESTARAKVMPAPASDMWSDLYAPVSEVELAPGKPRIAKVKNWLYESLYGHPPDHLVPPSSGSQQSRDKIRKYRRILVLTGPAGTGKTTTVKVLAREMGIDLVEWGEGVEERSLGGTIERESPIAKLSSFLSRHSFAPLNMSSKSASSGSKSPKAKSRVLFLTSLPNLHHLPTRDAFHAALLSFCQSFSSSSCPLIIVHSDAGSGGRAEESWMDRERGGREGILEVVGREVRDGPWCQEMDFISLAPTFITKALTRILNTAIPEQSKRPPTSALQLIAMTSNGDLRSAINSLQLLCSREMGSKGKKRKKRDHEGETGPPKKSGKGSRGGKGAKLDVSDDLRAVLDAVTRREQSLNLFHALGKVFYNKRLGDPGEEDEDAELLSFIKALPETEPLPDHLHDFERRKSLVQMETFLPTVPIDASSFALWIHQSLPTFCQEIEEVSAAMDDFCSADVMRTDDDIWHSSPQAIAYALHLTVRGAHMALPSPVIRNNQKLVKPQFFQSFRIERENIGHLDTAAGYLTKKGVTASTKLSETPLSSKGDGVWGGLHTKVVLATELIPMMIKIQGFSNHPLLPVTVKPLSLPPYYSAINREEELRATDEIPDETAFEASASGEDGLGTVHAGEGWDQEEGKEETGQEEELEDIQDWN